MVNEALLWGRKHLLPHQDGSACIKVWTLCGIKTFGSRNTQMNAHTLTHTLPNDSSVCLRVAAHTHTHTRCHKRTALLASMGDARGRMLVITYPSHLNPLHLLASRVSM